MSERIVKLWTGCELFIPLLIGMEDNRYTVRWPEHGDSLTLVTSLATLDEVIKDIERGESRDSWTVMGWAICRRRQRWVRAASERAEHALRLYDPPRARSPRIVVTPTIEEAEAERRFMYGGFRDVDIRALTILRARQAAAHQINVESGWWR